MADIILFNPAAWKRVGDIILPISLLAVSSLIDSKHRITIIDQQIDANWQASLKKVLKNNPICIGITCITGKQVKFALEASQIVRKECNAKIVWGGMQASQAPDVTLAHPLIDIIVKGEGYITFPKLIDALLQGEDLSHIEGIWFKKNGEIFKNPDRPAIDMDQLPILHIISLIPENIFEKLGTLDH